MTPWERASHVFLISSNLGVDHDDDYDEDEIASAKIVASEPALLSRSQSFDETTSASSPPTQHRNEPPRSSHRPQPQKEEKKNRKTASFKDGSRIENRNNNRKKKKKHQKLAVRRRSEPYIASGSAGGKSRSIGPNSRYVILEAKMARGNYAHIMRAYDSKLKCDVVIKCQKINSARGLQAHREYSFYKILESVWNDDPTSSYERGYQCIVQVFSQFSIQSGLKHCIVMEMANEGSLLEFLQKTAGGVQDYETARSMFNDMAESVHFLHRCNIAHRDIKPDNFLVFQDLATRKLTVKVCDLGYATYFTKSSRDTESCGSLHYAAPEILFNNVYSPPKLDVWSLGVTLFALNYGVLPFMDRRSTMENTQSYAQNVVAGRIIETRAPEDALELRTYLALKDLIRSMLCQVPESRFDMDQVLSHPWTTGECIRRRPKSFSENSPISDEIYEVPTCSSVDSVAASRKTADYLCAVSSEQKIAASYSSGDRKDTATTLVSDEVQNTKTVTTTRRKLLSIKKHCCNSIMGRK